MIKLLVRPTPLHSLNCNHGDNGNGKNFIIVERGEVKLLEGGSK
jgi:hypothetical protein